MFRPFVWFIMAVIVTLSFIPQHVCAGGGGDPFVGEWNLLTDSSHTFEIEKDRITGHYTYIDGEEKRNAVKEDRYLLRVDTDSGTMALSLNLLSGTITVTKKGDISEFRRHSHFIDLTFVNLIFLFLVGLIGGLVSGFIGIGTSFIYTPCMMSIGVDGLVAVASNVCHQFPRSLVGAYKRYKYGQVDVKLGAILAVSAVFGVLVGIRLQLYINEIWGDAGSNLYVSLAFVVVLLIFGTIVMLDARTIIRKGGAERTARLALALQKINLPPMIHFKTAGVRISFWFTVPIGFATGFLTSTIAAGGFIGIPGMIFMVGTSSIVASATGMVTDFGMGLVGSIKWGLLGLIDIRLTLIILAGSLFGVQVGAMATTYVKDYMIKLVMGSIMLIVAVSRIITIPTYLHELGWLSLSAHTIYLLKSAGFVAVALALLVGTTLIIRGMMKGMKGKKEMKDLTRK